MEEGFVEDYGFNPLIRFELKVQRKLAVSDENQTMARIAKK